MIKKILVPADGSERSFAASKYAISLAKQTKASMIVLSVVDDRELGLIMGATEGFGDVYDKVRENFLNLARSHVEKIEKEIEKAGIPVNTLVRIGNPAEEIVKEAERAKADLIVIGSHGRTALKSTILGSVAISVIHKETNIPVLIVRTGG